MISISHLHPMLVHFPIAILLLGMLAEIIWVIYRKNFFSEAAFYLLMLGTLSAIIAFLTGRFFTEEMTGASGDIRNTHQLFATITLIAAVCASIVSIYYKTRPLNQDKVSWLVFALYCIVGIAVGITGFFGGDLVYNYMMPL